MLDAPHFWQNMQRTGITASKISKASAETLGLFRCLLPAESWLLPPWFASAAFYSRFAATEHARRSRTLLQGRITRWRHLFRVA